MTRYELATQLRVIRDKRTTTPADGRVITSAIDELTKPAPPLPEREMADNKALADRLDSAWRTLYGDGDEHCVCDVIGEAVLALRESDALTATPSAQAGEVFGYVHGGCFIRAENWTDQARPEGWTPVYATLSPQADKARGEAAKLPAKWRAEADTCTNTCSNEDRGYNNAQYQLADELEAALTTPQPQGDASPLVSGGGERMSPYMAKRWLNELLEECDSTLHEYAYNEILAALSTLNDGG